MTETRPKCRVNWNKPYRAGTICNYVDEQTNECRQTDRARCPCGGIVRVPIFPQHPELREENKPGCFGAIGLPGKRNDPGCPCAWQERCRQSQEDC
jgi:hypothetical protein